MPAVPDVVGRSRAGQPVADVVAWQLFPVLAGLPGRRGDLRGRRIAALVVGRRGGVLGSVVCGSGGVASAGVVVFSSVFIRASRALRVPFREP